jgi:hypothetical protein
MPRSEVRRNGDKSKHVTRRAPKKRRKKRQPVDDTPILGPTNPVISVAEEASCNMQLRCLPGSSLSRDPDAPVTGRERKIVLASPGKTPYIGTPILGEPYPGGD